MQRLTAVNGPGQTRAPAAAGRRTNAGAGPASRPALLTSRPGRIVVPPSSQHGLAKGGVRSCDPLKAFASSRSNTPWRRRSVPPPGRSRRRRRSRWSAPGRAISPATTTITSTASRASSSGSTAASAASTLDVKHAEAAKVLERLLGGADVLVQNLAPGAAARLGLSHDEALAPTHPGSSSATSPATATADPSPRRRPTTC